MLELCVLGRSVSGLCVFLGWELGVLGQGFAAVERDGQNKKTLQWQILAFWVVQDATVAPREDPGENPESEFWLSLERPSLGLPSCLVWV